jgi:glycosyltransferase involved in cell wall biosynthesis
MTEGMRIRRTRDSGPCRVWIVNHYAGPPDRAAGTRHFSLARELVRRHADVTIFASGFGHNSRRRNRIRGHRAARSQVFDGVRFVWLRTFPYRGNTWRRTVNMASFAVMVVLAQINLPAPDVVVGSTVHPFAALAGWLVARLRGARFIYEVRDLWPQTLIDLGALAPSSLGARLLAGIEAFLVRRAEVVITLLPGISAYLDGRGLPSKHVRYLPNGVDFAEADQAAGKTEATAEPNDMASLLDDLEGRRAAGEVIFAYTGAHGRVNRLDVVLRALEIANRGSEMMIHLLMVGDGPEKPALERLAADLRLSNVQFVDAVPKARLPTLLAAVDVGVVHATATPVYRYGISFNKVFDYMAARKPIAFACSTYADPVARAGAGVTVAPDDPDALAGAFLSLAEASPEERRRLGEAGRSFVEREHDFARIGAVFAELVGCLDAPS